MPTFAPAAPSIATAISMPPEPIERASVSGRSITILLVVAGMVVAAVVIVVFKKKSS